MTEKEIIEEYKRKKALEEATARHSYQAQTSYNNFVEDLEKRRRDYYTSELQSEIKADTDADLVPLQEERQSQAQAGNTGYVGGTGDNLLLDNNNNFVEQPSPFDVSQVTYNTRQRYADEIMENRKEYVNQLGEENYYKVLDQLETTDQTPDLGADYKSAKLALDVDLAWSDYLESGTIADRQKAEKLSKEYEQFMEDNGYKVGNAPFASQVVGHIPQEGYYLSSNIPAGLLAGATYLGTSFLSKSKTIAGLAAQGVWDLASLGTGYEATRRMTQGAAYKTLLDMGVSEDRAKYWAQETAKQQATVEVAPEVGEKLIGWAVAAFSSGSMPAKIFKGLLTSYGVNIAEESLEEFAQEWQQISAEKNALAESGLDTSQYTPEYEWGRKAEAAVGVIPVTMTFGALGSGVPQTARTILVDKKNIQSIKQGYQSAITNLQEKNTELQNKLDNEELTSKQRYETNKQIKANNKEIKYLQEQSSDENVESAYNQWKQFQEALKESQELRDSTKFVSVEYNDNINTTLENAQTKAREQFGNNELQIEAETEITQAEKNLKDVVEKSTGKNVVFYSVFGLDNLGNIRGFVEDGNTIYIEAGQSAKDTIAAASHEMGHIIANGNKVLFDTFKSLAGAKLGAEGLYNKIVEMNNKTGTYKLQEGQRLTTKQQNYLLEEMFGDYLAEIASKAKNVKALENSTLSVFDRLKDYAKNLANEALGREQENTRISGYDYSGVSYAEGDILENTDFEKQVMETLKSLKPTDQVKEATKTTEKILQDNKKVEAKKTGQKSNAKTPAEGVRARIEARYKEMRNKSTPESIRKMIAEELGVEYNGAKDNSRDAIRVRDMYETLKENKGKLSEEGVKLSAKKYIPAPKGVNVLKRKGKSKAVKYAHDLTDANGEIEINYDNSSIKWNPSERNNGAKIGAEHRRNTNDIEQNVLTRTSGRNIGISSNSQETNRDRSLEERDTNTKQIRNRGLEDSSSSSMPKKATEADYSEGYTTSNGTPITNGIAGWAKNSKMREGFNEDGKLKLGYHGSPWLFEEFKDTYTHNGKTLGHGYYLTFNRSKAEKSYAYSEGDTVYELVMNITNPFNLSSWHRDKQKILDRVPELVRKFDQEGIKEHARWGEDGYIDEMKLWIDEGRESWQRLSDPPDEYDTIKIINDVANRNDEDTREIWKWLGYDGLQVGDEVVIFDSNQAKAPDNPNPTSDNRFKFSSRKEINRDQIINNQLNEIAKQDEKIASLKATNKEQNQEIKDITKQAKKDNASYQRAVKNKGKQIEELNIKGYRKDEKIAKLINTIEDKNVSIRAKQYDREFDRYARKSEFSFNSDDRFRYLILRFEKVKPAKAFEQVQEMRASLSELETNINRSLDLIREWFKDAVYKKLSPELKKEVDGFNKYYRKGATITARNLLNMQLTSEYLKNLQGKAILTNRVQKQILDDGEPIALADILKTKDEAREFINSVEALNEKIIEDRQRNIRNETKETFKEDLAKAKGDIEAEIPNSKAPTTTIKRANKQLMTFKTQTEALFGGKKDSGAMYLDNNVRNGLRRQRRFVSNIYKMLDDFTEDSTGFNGLIHRRQWNKDIQKATDHKSAYVKPVSGVPAMPLGVIMSFAAGRNDAQYMSHITGAITSAKVIAGDGFIMPKIEFKEGGGVLIPDEKLYRTGKIDEAYKRGRVYKLTLDQVDELINSLTPEQKKFAETIHDIYEYTGEAINEVSNRIYGYDLAQVKDYFPIRVAGNESIWEEVKSMDVKNMLNTYRNALASNVLFGNPQLKPRSEASFSPIYGENIVDTLQRTINNIGTFYGYAEALWKNDMFLNSGFEDGGIKVGDGEAKNTLRAALDYLDSDYLKDYKRLTNYIVGLERQPDGALRRWMGARTLTFNIGTWFTQPASFASTYRYYSQGRFWESLIKSHNIGGDSVNKQIKSYFEEQGIDTDGISNFDLMRMFVSEASPFLDVRGIGFRAPDLRGLIGKPWYDKLSPKMIELFDDMAVSTIARMQIYNTSLEETFGTEAYFEKLGNNLEMVLSETQPDKADINKANMFRSDKGALRTLTMFGQPANQLYNNIAQTTLELQYAMKNGTTEEKNKALGNFGKAVGSIIVGQVYVALVRATREAIRAKDDDDTEFWKRWLSNFIVAMASPTLIGDEIAGFIMSKAKFGSTQFYDFESPDTAIMNNVVDFAEKIMNMFDAELSPTKKVVDTIKAVGNVAPIDTRSVVHLTEGLLRGLFPGVYKAYSLQTNKDAYKSWAKTKSTPMSEFYSAYIATRNASLKKNYGYIEKSKTGSESSKKESIKRALNDVFNNDEEKVDKYMHGILFDYTD